MTVLVVLAVLFTCSNDTIAQEFKFLEVKVFDENGKPMADVPVEIKMDGMKFPMSTNELGMISLNVSSGRNPVELNIRHKRYESQKVRWQRGSEVPEEHTIQMQLGMPSQGLVVDADGNPVARAEIFVAPPDESLTIVNGETPKNSRLKPVATDEQGKFELPFQPEGSTIVCLSDAGWAQLVMPKKQADSSLEIRLTLWIHVQLLTQLGAESVGLHFLNALPKDQGKVSWFYGGETDKQGHFSCDRVIQGNAMAYQMAPLQLVQGQPEIENRSHGVLVMLQESGSRIQVSIGKAKQKAIGKLVMPVDYPGKAIWSSGYVVLTEANVVKLAMRTLVFEYGKMLSQASVFDPRQRVPPSMQPNYLVRYLATVQPDGMFTIDGVPAGNYKLSAVLAAQPKLDHKTIDLLSLEDLSFTIPKLEDESSFDLGEHILDHTNSFTKHAE